MIKENPMFTYWYLSNFCHPNPWTFNYSIFIHIFYSSNDFSHSHYIFLLPSAIVSKQRLPPLSSNKPPSPISLSLAIPPPYGYAIAPTTTLTCWSELS